MINGYAKLDATKEYFEKLCIKNECLKHTEDFYTLPIAIGTHLGDFSDEDSLSYIETVSYGLKNGVNFIDTAINYRGMRSEKDIGTVLNKLITIDKSINREEIVISSKGGQIYGDCLLGVKPIDYLNNILIPNGILTMDDVNFVGDHRFTLEPKFYENCIEMSKKNLGLETIDIHYIHNPEVSMYVLGEESFYKSLERLFSFYEEQVSKGNIRYYGFATWSGLLENVDSKWYISLEKVVKIAKGIAGENHHFKFVQLPYNKINELAKLKGNQIFKNTWSSAINVASMLGLKVTVSSPLNQGNKLTLNKFTSVEALKYVINTPGVYAAMVGTKNKSHLIDNLKGVNIYDFNN